MALLQEIIRSSLSSLHLQYLSCLVSHAQDWIYSNISYQKMYVSLRYVPLNLVKITSEFDRKYTGLENDAALEGHW